MKCRLDDSDSHFDDMLIRDLLNGRFSKNVDPEFGNEAKPDKMQNKNATKKKYRKRVNKVSKKESNAYV